MRQYARPVSVPDPHHSDRHDLPPTVPAKRAYRRNADGSPVLRRHHSGRSFVRIGGKDYSCGKYGTPEATAEYRRMTAEFALTGKVTPRKPANQRTPEAITINELALAYWRQSKETFSTSTTSSEWNETVRIRLAIMVLVKLYGYIPAADFGPQQLIVIQKTFIEEGLP